MSMPIDFVEIRHGTSEANIFQSLRKRDPDAPLPDEFLERHDSQMRLAPPGRDQADAAGEWIRKEFGADFFDRKYVSSHIRTIETAGRLALAGTWYIDPRWVERDWGEYGALSGTEQQALYERSTRIRHLSKWYWCPPGGESLASGVLSRFRDILDTMHRELGGKAVLAVTHGEVMEVSRAVLEGLLPEEWAAQERDPRYKLANCHILHWTRRNPETGEIEPHIGWRRSICPWDPEKSWDNGEWVKIDRRRVYSGDQLLAMAEAVPPLFPEK